MAQAVERLRAGWQWTGLRPEPQPRRQSLPPQLRRTVLLPFRAGLRSESERQTRLLVVSAPLPSENNV